MNYTFKIRNYYATDILKKQPLNSIVLDNRHHLLYRMTW